MSSILISVIYEDDNLIAVNKPAGIITHPKNESDLSPSLTAWVLENHPDIKGVGEYPDRPGMMHRLDKDTSGVILIAKNQPAYDYLKNLFQTRKIKKYYLALVIGRPKSEKGMIDTPIGRIGMKRTTIPKNGKLKDKKEAVTNYRVVKKYHDFTLIEAAPKTGRTHQIRVHLKHIGHPIAGDVLYAPKNSPRPKDLERLFLHAERIEFTSPDGRALSIQAELPLELELALKGLPK